MIYSELVKLYDRPDLAGYERMGNALAISGDYIVVGAWGRDDGGLQDCGAAYVYKRQPDGSYAFFQKLSPSYANVNQQFGYSAAIDGDTILVGAKYDSETFPNAGAVYVFKLSAGTWSQTQKLVSSDLAQGDYFGWAVAVDGNRAMIGAPKDLSGYGSVYVFERGIAADPFGEVQKLTCPDSLSDQQFGYRLTLEGDTALIGAPRTSTSYAGRAYIFERSGGSWGHVQTLPAPDINDSDNFGTTVLLSGDKAFVAATGYDGGGTGRGAVYYYAKSGTWPSTATQVLEHPDPQDFSYFGSGIAYDADKDELFVGTSGRDTQSGVLWNAGDFSRFVGAAGTYALGETYEAEDADAEDYFGGSLFYAAGRLYVGATGWDDAAAANCGAIYVYERPAVGRDTAPNDGDGWLINDAGDNELTAGGALVREPSVATRCRFRLLARRGQVTWDRELGSDLFKIRLLDGAQRKADRTVKRALQPLVDEGAIVGAQVGQVEKDHKAGALFVPIEIQLPDGGTLPLGSFELGR